MVHFILEKTKDTNEEGAKVFKVWVESPDGTSRHLCGYKTKEQIENEFHLGGDRDVQH